MVVAGGLGALLFLLLLWLVLFPPRGAHRWRRRTRFLRKRLRPRHYRGW